MALKILTVTYDEQTGDIIGARQGGNVMTGVARVSVSKGSVRVLDHAGRNLLPEATSEPARAADEALGATAADIARYLGFADEGEAAQAKSSPAQGDDEVKTFADLGKVRAAPADGRGRA